MQVICVYTCYGHIADNLLIAHGQNIRASAAVTVVLLMSDDDDDDDKLAAATAASVNRTGSIYAQPAKCIQQWRWLRGLCILNVIRRLADVSLECWEVINSTVVMNDFAAVLQTYVILQFTYLRLYIYIYIYTSLFIIIW